jgi:hypothetical protein
MSSKFSHSTDDATAVTIRHPITKILQEPEFSPLAAIWASPTAAGYLPAVGGVAVS